MGLKTEGEKRCFESGLLGADVYVGLHTGEPEAANELSANGYARVAVAPAGWTVDAVTGAASNADAIDFPERTAPWGDPTHVGLWDAANGGNLLASFALSADTSAPQPYVEVDFPAGALTLSFPTD